MDQAAEILVIIVSGTLFIFLVVGIILAIYLIRLTAEIRRVAKSAQNTVSHIENTVVNVTRITSPLYVAELVKKYVDKFKSSKGDK